MITTVAPDKHNRIVLTRDIRKAAGLTSGERLKLSASPGRIVLEVKSQANGMIIKKGGLKIWTGKIPAVPLEEAVEKTRDYSR